MKKLQLITLSIAIGTIFTSYARDPSTRGWGAISKGIDEGMEYGLRTQEIANQQRAIEAEIQNQERIAKAEIENQKRFIEADNKIKELEYSIKLQQLENEKIKGQQLKKSLRDKPPPLKK